MPPDRGPSPDIVTLRIRRAVARDLPAIRANHAITHEEHVAREPDYTSDAPFIDPYIAHVNAPAVAIRNALSRRRYVVLAAYLGDRFAGHLCYVRHSTWLHPFAAYVTDISVTPDARGQGVARSLLQAMLQRETRCGVHNFAAEIWPENRASRGLFAAAGYNIGPPKDLPDHPQLWFASKSTPTTGWTQTLIWLRTAAAYAPAFALLPLLRNLL